MRFTLLGTGTSQGVPIIGCSCAACTSQDPADNRTRTSALIQSDQANIVIDVGPDFRQQMLRENVQDLDAVLITHEHNDHIIGLDDLRPLIFKRAKAMKIYGEARILEEIRTRFAYAFIKQAYPGAPVLELIPIAPGDELNFGDISVQVVRVNHGRLPILGFVVNHQLAYFTDTNNIPSETLEIVRKLPLLFLDMLRFGPHHSHNSFNEAIEIAESVSATKTYFIHMSHDLGPTKEWSQLLPPDVYASYDGLSFEI